MQRVIAQIALVRESGASLALLRKLERAGLLVLRARSRGASYYDESAIERVERVLSLQQAGYALRDIAVIVGRVEQTETKKPLRVIELSELLQREPNPSQVRELIDVGLLKAKAVVRGGELLLGAAAAQRVKLLGLMRELDFQVAAETLSEVAEGSAQERVILAQAQAEVQRKVKRMVQLKRLLQVTRARAQFRLNAAD